jgi:hypothetical protein
MGPQIDIAELRAAWRALESQSDDPGWRTIPILAGSACPIRAGREFPGNEETILVGFRGIRRPIVGSLPQGQGFVVSCPEVEGVEREHVWIGLARQPGGDLELFATMAADVLGMLQGRYVTDDPRRFSAFVDRIRSWQEFMRRGTLQILSPESELGLVGELEMLRSLLQYGYTAGASVEAWKGPRRGLHDFSFAIGAIEVKSAISTRGFPAHIVSLDQLDDQIVHPLYLAALRMVLTPGGTTLSERVEALRDLLAVDEVARADFDSRLIQAGYLDAVRQSYVRRFQLGTMQYFAVTDSFPSLTVRSVPRGVRAANYELDLDLITEAPVDAAVVLQQLGVAF